MTCKDCVHYELCKYNTYQQAHYFGKDKNIYITIDNDSPCKFFKNKANMVEVLHGKWKFKDTKTFADGSLSTKFLCSVCGREVVVNHEFGTNAYRYAKNTLYPYCHCGSKMDGKDGAGE